MADNLGVNPKKAFSSDDEGVAYPVLAQMLAVEVYNDTIWDKDHSLERLEFKDTYVVSFTYVMGNWKAYVSTNRPDGRIFEVTHNKDENETYVDEYQKQNQTIWPC